MRLNPFRFRIEARASMSLLRFVLSVLHLSIAGLGFWRHNMVELVPGYRPFGEVATTNAWSTLALVVGLGLLLLRRGTLSLIVWQFFSATFFTAFAILVSGTYGVIWGTLSWSFPAALSYVVMWFSAQDWAAEHDWYHNAKDRVQKRRQYG